MVQYLFLERKQSLHPRVPSKKYLISEQEAKRRQQRNEEFQNISFIRANAMHQRNEVINERLQVKQPVGNIIIPT